MDAESEGLEGVIEGMRTILQYLQAKSFIRTLKINSQARHPPRNRGCRVGLSSRGVLSRHS